MIRPASTTHVRVDVAGCPARGAASLIVVMLLFLVLSLTAAYTSRNLVFEQKTSANQARSTTAFEAADAGVDWVLTQLNGGRIANTCETPSAITDQSFQQRYLAIANGNITQAIRATGTEAKLWPACVFNGTTWTCACPTTAALAPSPLPSGNGPFPAFRVWPAVVEAPTATASPWTLYPVSRPGVLRLTVAGCTKLPSTSTETCLNYAARGEIGEGLSGVRALLALRSGLVTLPAAAVTARLGVTPAAVTGDRRLYVVNTDAASQGFTVNTADLIDPDRFVAQSLPGTPSANSMAAGDKRLQDLVPSIGASPYGVLNHGERMFVMTFGMKKATYRDQPGLRMCVAPCDATQINNLLLDHPNRIIWVDGSLTLNANIGIPPNPALTPPVPAQPVLLIVNGETLTLDPGVAIYGFVYMTGGATALSTIALPDAGPLVNAITGALVAEGNLVTTYSGTPAPPSRLTVTYDAAALELLRTTYGSWVKLPGSWRDFKEPPPP